VNNTAGPADCPALLEAVGILHTRFAQTCKILFDSFCGARQVPMGKATLSRCLVGRVERDSGSTFPRRPPLFWRNRFAFRPTVLRSYYITAFQGG
jgi:hypothetical protein